MAPHSVCCQVGSHERRGSTSRYPLGNLAGLAFFCLLLGLGKESLGGKDIATTAQLVPGKARSGLIPVRDSESFSTTLNPGQFLHIVVDQKQNDLALALFGPEVEKLSEVDGRVFGPESISLVAQKYGIFRVQVSYCLERVLEDLRGSTMCAWSS